MAASSLTHARRLNADALALNLDDPEAGPHVAGGVTSEAHAVPRAAVRPPGRAHVVPRTAGSGGTAPLPLPSLPAVQQRSFGLLFGLAVAAGFFLAQQASTTKTTVPAVRSTPGDQTSFREEPTAWSPAPASPSRSGPPSPTTTATATATQSAAPSASSSTSPLPHDAQLGPVDAATGTMSIVDGIAGYPVHPAWLPKRTRASLSSSSGVPQAVAMSVDNWWHLHPQVRAVSPEAAFSNQSIAAAMGLFGQVGMMRGAVGVGGVQYAPVSPPLPACVPLTEDTLQHPLLNSIKSFTEYPISSIVSKSIDHHSYVTEVGSSAAIAAQSNPEPYSKVRALMWHRIAFDDAAVHGLSFPVADGLESYFPHYTPGGRDRFCARLGDWPRELHPTLPCDGSAPQPPIVLYPWCTRPTSPVAIISYDCGMAESHYAHEEISWNLMTLDAGGWVLTTNAGRWAWPQDRHVHEFDEVGTTSTQVYFDVAGHFFNEVLPKLVLLDTMLPLHIPILWPYGVLPSAILQEFQAAGLLNANRQFLALPKPNLVRAKRLYTIASEYDAGYAPLVLSVSQRLLGSRLHAALWQKYSGPPPTANNIVILSRGQGKRRSMENEAALVSALQAAHPGVRIDVFEPMTSMPFLEIAARVYSARLIMGVHGANLNNMVAARPGATIVEVGFLSGGSMNMPADYFCLARNLGLQYWMSPAERGTYDSTAYAHIQDLLDIAAAALAGQPPPQIPSPL